jgi:signal transduction histidine kinase
MGLGLAIVRNAVLAHGGNVSAKNVAPHGLEVELRVPILLPSQPTHSDAVRPRQALRQPVRP